MKEPLHPVEFAACERTCLIVDDDDVLRTRLARAMQRRGLEVKTAANYDDALREIEQASPDLAVIDLKMPGESGLELLRSLRERSPETRSVVLTGYGSIANAVEAMKLGAHDYLTKPADAEQILAAMADKQETPSEAVSFQPQSLAEAEWEHIQRVLADCGGNISEAARQLGIPRRTLQRKLKKLAP
ncbi:MAG: response regulator [Pirellulaceae bacterium]